MICLCLVLRWVFSAFLDRKKLLQCWQMWPGLSICLDSMWYLTLVLLETNPHARHLHLPPPKLTIKRNMSSKIKRVVDKKSINQSWTQTVIACILFEKVTILGKKIRQIEDDLWTVEVVYAVCWCELQESFSRIKVCCSGDRSRGQGCPWSAWTLRDRKPCAGSRPWSGTPCTWTPSLRRWWSFPGFQAPWLRSDLQEDNNKNHYLNKRTPNQHRI